jgi:hypothetical protein
VTRKEINQRYYAKHNKYQKLKEKAAWSVLHQEADIPAQERKVELLSKRYFKTPSRFRAKVGRELLQEIYYLQALLSE